MKTTLATILFVSLLSAAAVNAQSVKPSVTWNDYQRASTLRSKYQGLVIGEAGPPTFFSGSLFWYRRTVEGGNEFILADAKTAAKKPAFDHARLATALGVTAVTLPF